MCGFIFNIQIKITYQISISTITYSSYGLLVKCHAEKLWHILVLIVFHKSMSNFVISADGNWSVLSFKFIQIWVESIGNNISTMMRGACK